MLLEQVFYQSIGKNIWCSVPSIDIDEYSFNTREGFDTFSNCLLLLREKDASYIPKFRLSLGYMIPSNVSKVNAWIIYALQRNVEVADIYLLDDHQDMSLTQHLLTSESLRELRLSNHELRLSDELRLSAQICLPMLRILHLNYVTVKDSKLDEALFSAIPSLETIILENCLFNPSDKPLIISARQLKTLKLVGDFHNSIVVSASNLVSLELHLKNKISLIRFDSEAMFLYTAIIDLRVDFSESTAQLISMVKNVQYLTLTIHFVLTFSSGLRRDSSMLKFIGPTFYNLRWLKMETLFSKHEIALINHLIKRTPKIETVILVNKGVEKDQNIIRLWDATFDEHYDTEKIWSTHQLSHLKFVKLQNFKGWEMEVNTVKYFLKNAIILERLTIIVSKFDEHCTSQDKRKIAKIQEALLTYPRASSSLGILYTQNM